MLRSVLARDGYSTREHQDENFHGQRGLQQKNIIDKQAKHRTQEEIGYVLRVRHCIIWLRDLDNMVIGAGIFGEL
jgi:hypothetical protein